MYYTIVTSIVFSVTPTLLKLTTIQICIFLSNHQKSKQTPTVISVMLQIHMYSFKTICTIQMSENIFLLMRSIFMLHTNLFYDEPFLRKLIKFELHIN